MDIKRNITKRDAKAIPFPRMSAKTWLVVLAIFALLASSIPFAQAADNPKIMLEKTAKEMITALNENREQIKKDPNITQQLIEEKLLPHLDFITASKYVLGAHWDTASKKQKIGFIKAFRKLLLSFYSSALTEYLNSHDDMLDPSIIVFFDPSDSSAKQILMRSEVQPKSGKAVPVNYKMHKTRKGWKIIDVSVEGVSVITTYKTSFASEIKASGLDALIASLQSRNSKLHTATNS